MGALALVLLGAAIGAGGVILYFIREGNAYKRTADR
jgi:hypothetical protein